MASVLTLLSPLVPSLLRNTARARWACALTVSLGTMCVLAQAADPQRLFQAAMAAQQRGDDAAAVRGYRELLRLHPEATEARVNLGAALADQKHFSEAIEQYRIVLAADPTNRMARMNMALAYQGNGDLPDAIKQLQQLYRENARDGQTRMLLADCLGQSGRYTEAVLLLTPLEAADPGNLDVQWLLGSSMIHAGRPAEGVARVEKVAERGASADAYLLAGQTRLAMNQYDLAHRDADAAQRLNPALEGLSTLTGMILEQQGNYDGAEAALLKSLAVNANDFDAHLYLGGIYYFKRNMEDARLHLTKALQLQPTSAQARYELALVAHADGQLDIAVRYLETLVHQSPDWLQPHVELAALYYRLHRPEDGARERRIVDRMMDTQQQTQSAAAR
jgi:tetratricopeptide (TPR) repeat protein